MSRRFLTYPNVMSTLALFIALGGGAYALSKDSVGSRQVRNDSLQSRDVQDTSLRGKDLRLGTIGELQLDERHIDISRFVQAKSESFFCDPAGGTFEDCVGLDLNIREPSQVFLTGAGGQESLGGQPASGRCRFEVDGAAVQQPSFDIGEDMDDNTDARANNGFGMTYVTSPVERIRPGVHTFTIACNELEGNTRIDASLSALAFGGTP